MKKGEGSGQKRAFRVLGLERHGQLERLKVTEGSEVPEGLDRRRAGPQSWGPFHFNQVNQFRF